MENNLFRLGLIFTIIVLFVGASVTTTMSENIEKISHTSVNNFSNNCSNFYNSLLAYWSFDEGSGNIANDYSGHGYDGIIQGATWTTGYSNYALNFDGELDYIILDDHSKELGFNKTDDYKISAWINTTLTDPGVIYIISYFVPFPMFYIKFNSDGTLEIRHQSTSWCRITVNSNDSYNDGLWHYIEAIYHGGLYPLIELYVDGELVISVTDWLCPFNSYQFEEVKIGMASYDSIDMFKGIIDEVKVYKRPLGNQPPYAPEISGTISGTVGMEYSYTIVTSDSEEDDLYYWVDWGDNTNTGWIGPYKSYEEVSVNHTWSKNGAYEIKAKAKDHFDIGEWSTFLINMRDNIVPTPPSITGPTNGVKGKLFEYKFVSTDINGHDVKYNIDWGDNNIEWTDYYESGEEVILHHSWSKQDIYTIQAKAKDIQDGESNWSEPFTVTITEKAVLMGFITNMSINGELTSFNAKQLFYLRLRPLDSRFFLSGEKIIISTEYTGKISEQYIFGIERG